MTLDDDEVRAMENRLRQNGWTDKPSPEHPATRKRGPIAPPPKRFGSPDGRISEAAQQLAKSFDGFTWPTYGWIASAYGCSYDDAVRALAEAKRLAGAEP